MSSSSDTALEAIVQRGLEAYRAGQFFEAHELWEAGWRDEQNPVRKTFLQGLILVAAALHKLTRMRSPSGAVRLLDKAHDTRQRGLIPGCRDAHTQTAIAVNRSGDDLHARHLVNRFRLSCDH